MLLTVKEVAQRLRASPAMVYRLYHSGLLKMIKIGSLKCREETLNEFIEKYDGYDVSFPELGARKL